MPTEGPGVSGGQGQRFGRPDGEYLKQIKHFTDLIKKGKCDYFYAERAVHIQELVDGIYAEQ